MSHNQFSQFLNVAVCQTKCRLSCNYIQCHTTKADLILVALSGYFHLWVNCASRIAAEQNLNPAKRCGLPSASVADHQTFDSVWPEGLGQKTHGRCQKSHLLWFSGPTSKNRQKTDPPDHFYYIFVSKCSRKFQFWLKKIFIT